MEKPVAKYAAEQALKEGYNFLQSGAHEQALASFTRAEDLFGEAGDRRRQARACTNIAYARFMKKEYPEALRCYREALSLYTETGTEEKRRLTAENVARLEAALVEPAE